MRDPRATPANGRVACERLQGQVIADHYVTGAARQLAVPVADLLRAPHGPRDRQLLMGEGLRMLDDHEGWAFVELDRDGYCGYLPSKYLIEASPATHRVSAPSSHVYSEASFKSADLMPLSFGSRVQALSEEGSFLRSAHGFIPKQHVSPIAQTERIPSQVARLFLGTPYLWGGNSRFGIDCSGLVQAALLACGQACPGDSDQQESTLGRTVSGQPQANDLLFWKGHVAMAVDAKTLIHANAHHMAVVLEGIDDAIERIRSQGDGDPTRHARL